MTMVVRANHLLGTFLGHRDVGRVADFPDTARLHAALVHAAGKGSTAVDEDGQLRPSAQSLAALQWLEEHPPRGLSFPRCLRVSTRPARSWRREGTIVKMLGAIVEDKELKSQSDAVAVSGPFEWGWDGVPAEIADTIAQLCGDVSCLGESDSPVLLTTEITDSWEPTHELDTDDGFPSPGGVAVRTPIPGRFNELESAYRQAHPGKKSATGDGHSFSETPRPPAATAHRLEEMRYRAPDRVASAPWSQVVLLRIDGELDTARSVEWAVALHRALAARLGDDAPPFITGDYPDGQAKPANRMAVHLLPPTPLMTDVQSVPVFALMLPNATEPEARVALLHALRGLREVYCRAGRVAIEIVPTAIDTDSFWRTPEPGMVRRWRPLPALVPEVRRQVGTSGKPWTLANAAAVSAAFVFRDEFPDGFAGPNRYARAAEAAEARGFRISEVRILADSRTQRYAHKMPKGVIMQPYTGLVDLGSFSSARRLLALGQSRHLGGGLLWPEDLPLPIAEARGLL